MASVCDGLTILDLGHGMAGGLTTMVMADAGAEVIKVEPPSGDPARKQAGFVQWGRGKKSVVLDLTTPEGLGEFSTLAASADIITTNWSPGTAEKLGIHFSALRELNPGLITCSITGFGPLKEYAHLKGYEGIVAAKTGRFHAFDNQIPKDGPIYAALPCGTWGATMYAVQGIMAALYARSKTGMGQDVATSLLQGLTAYDWAWLTLQQEEAGTFKGFVRGSPTPQYYVAQCGDGRWLQMANSMSHFVINFVVGIGASDLLDDPRFAGVPNIDVGEDMEDMYKIWHAKMQEKGIEEWSHIFTHEVDVGSEPFMTTQEGMSHPQALHNGNIIDLEDPSVGPTRQLGPFITFSKTPMSPQGPAPSLGQHTEEVLKTTRNRKADAAKQTLPKKGGSNAGPLDGVTVVELASWFAAPFGPSILADLGARVIKLEHLDGDPWRASGPMGVRTIQGKESIALDLKKPEAQAIAHKLVAKADIFMHNFRPGIPERLGLSYDQASAVNPKLVYLYSGAYGSTGPSSHRPAFHPIPGAICGGALYQAGRGTPPPPETPLTYEQVRATASTLFRANEGNPDVNAAVSVATAMLMGLQARERTGKGQYLETSMLCANYYINSDDCIQFDGKEPRLLPDPELNGLHALYRSYKAKDDWVFLACVTQDEWQALCQELSDPSLLANPLFSTPELRVSHESQLAATLEPIFLRRTALDWESALSAKDVGCAAVRPTGLQHFANHDQSMKDAGMWLPVAHPSLGDYWRYGPPITFSENATCAGPTTFIGEHTQSILKELGYDTTTMEELRAGKVIGWKTER